MSRINLFTFATFAVALASMHCGSDPIELAGTWTSSFGGTETITEKDWNGTTIVEVDNDGNAAYLQNPSTAQFFPGKFSKNVWTELSGNSFYYCTVAFGQDTLDRVKTSTQTADASSPDTKGCGGFGWTKLTKM